MLQAIVIDDEPKALEVIRELTRKVTFIDVKGYFTDAFDALGFMQQNVVQLVFLDINMPDISGIQFVKTMPDPPMIVFTTAYSQYAVEGFELNAIDYLLKPFSLARFLMACNKAYEQYQLRQKKPVTLPAVFIKSGYEQVRVELEEVLYAESCGNYVQFVTTGQKIASRLTMGEAEALLPASHFIRIHRSYIVALKHITKIDRRAAWIGKGELPIGPAYLSEIDKKIK
ncbi:MULTISPECIES: LytR/AlgR family response regulator transcription factor [Niastella]|uniref:Response regulator transcription factor n=1 Tax=Niastella soli TaxID=2821487 RepID=A0ABS3YLC3_9BACT|nr:LytTR family DNA-binding domain-containing protein [Niastella soli]MBO9198694.1 response regulator transcription factor [Niastella soli]